MFRVGICGVLACGCGVAEYREGIGELVKIKVRVLKAVLEEVHTGG